MGICTDDRKTASGVNHVLQINDGHDGCQGEEKQEKNICVKTKCSRFWFGSKSAISASLQQENLNLLKFDNSLNLIQKEFTHLNLTLVWRIFEQLIQNSEKEIFLYSITNYDRTGKKEKGKSELKVLEKRRRKLMMKTKSVTELVELKKWRKEEQICFPR